MTTKTLRTRKPRPAPGFVIYDGPSMLDGSPIVVIATALRQSRNKKTGHMVQTYIIRKDMHPIEAVRTGKDAAICGDCKHRGDGAGKQRSCYVTLAHGPSNVYRSYLRGVYPALSPAAVGLLVAGRPVRLGTYGDPAAAPLAVWQALTAHASAWTGYTHQWATLSSGNPDAPRTAPFWQSLLMASVDTAEEYAEAQWLGWRTFRVGSAPVAKREVTCPASAEAGKKTTCEACRACMGTSAKARVSIQIAPHGAGRKHAGIAA